MLAILQFRCKFWGFNIPKLISFVWFQWLLRLKWNSFVMNPNRTINLLIFVVLTVQTLRIFIIEIFRLPLFTILNGPKFRVIKENVRLLNIGWRAMLFLVLVYRRLTVSTRAYTGVDMEHITDFGVIRTRSQMMIWSKFQYHATFFLSWRDFRILIALFRPCSLPIDVMYWTLFHWLHLKSFRIITFFIESQTILLRYLIFLGRQQIDSDTSFLEA